jgi:hypothetical protein
VVQLQPADARLHLLHHHRFSKAHRRIRQRGAAACLWQVLDTIQKYTNSGCSNAQSFGLEVERRYNKDYAFQFSYVMTNALMTSLNGTVNPVNQYLPGAVPTDYDARNRSLNDDTSIPKHRVKWNWLIDVPAGKGKALGRNTGNVLDKFLDG